jgi:hypothetical protein
MRGNERATTWEKWLKTQPEYALSAAERATLPEGSTAL